MTQWSVDYVAACGGFFCWICWLFVVCGLFYAIMMLFCFAFGLAGFGRLLACLLVYLFSVCVWFCVCCFRLRVCGFG